MTVSIDDGDVLFVGDREWTINAITGIYLYDGDESVLSVVADRNTPFPGGTGNFSDFFSADFYDDRVGFLESGDNGELGNYILLGSSLSVIGDALDGDTVIGLSGTSLSGNSVAFYAFHAPRPAIYRADAVLRGCPTSLALADHTERGEIQRDLYRLRDEILDRSESGKYFTQLFYRHAEEIRSLMERYPDLEDTHRENPGGARAEDCGRRRRRHGSSVR